MKILDPGHSYLLDELDGESKQPLTFVKREGEKYPGNLGHYPGVQMQEVLRALIDRIRYVNAQKFDQNNLLVLLCLRAAFNALEERAATLKGIPPGRVYREYDPVGADGHVKA